MAERHNHPLQLELPQENAEDTEYVRRLKQTVVASGELKGNRACVTFKIDRQRHAELLRLCSKHGITMTDLLTVHIDRIMPILSRATPVEVPGYKVDKRTRPRPRMLRSE